MNEETNIKPVYKVKELNTENPALSTIEKSGFTVDITLADYEHSHKLNQKAIENIEAEVRIKKALQTNISTNHPEIAELSEEIRIGTHLYHEADRYIKVAEDKLQEFAKAQAELSDEIEQIKVQTGITSVVPQEVQEVAVEEVNEKQD